MEPLAVIFGRRVRSLRETRKWTQEQLAKATGLGPKHIGVIERGEKTSSFDAVQRIAEALQVNYYELFVPMNRRTLVVERAINEMLADAERIELANVEEFLRALRSSLRKLDRKASV